MGNDLDRYARNGCSQFGEDGILERVFEILPKQAEYWCVEFGAWDGKYLSNTYQLIANRNWKGVLIEGNSSKFPDLERTFKDREDVTLVNALVSFEGDNTLDKILERTDIPVDLDLLSVDIDGNDHHIWESLKGYRPKVVVIEFNQTIPSDVEFVQEKNMAVNHGSSLLSLTKLGKQKGYELIAATVCNAVFVRKEFFDLFGIQDNSPSILWSKERPAPRVFQLYDGTLVFSERFKLIWHDKYVNEQDFQALPKLLRFFGDSTNMNWSYRNVLRKIYYKLQPARNKRR